MQLLESGSGTLPRARPQPGTSENSITLPVAKPLADRGKMTQCRLPLAVAAAVHNSRLY